MWIFLNDAFFSVVDHDAKNGRKREAERIPLDTDMLVVRARLQGDIEKVFEPLLKAAGQKLTVTRNDRTDYRYRTLISRGVFKQAMLAEVDRITYGNFKDSVHEHERHDAYSRVWGVMYGLQNPKPRAKRSATKNLFSDQHP